eukprot:CAMPEP_0177539470 /NCGR_PEP_ID=MMETSP0369-20130122/58981_1 /TAXON_ID=447022 ORGANISM="Scrippsiella hangoei-like, Strain SHHI-4" /NCGR_SAMPLE_ID=MMETSP0369 /ASSEMBLY_ACC=CAM_ASM_000364 /LENGTH=185 /DNA_ID=CAMNT_0019022457 /DNA_START=79 /DNA_END=636 /DNA_ORIENTATION=+
MVCGCGVARKFPANYALLLFVTVCTGVMVGYASKATSWQSDMLSAGMMSLVVLALSIYSRASEADFMGFRPLLVAVSCAACAIGGLFSMPDRIVMILYDFVAVLLFCAFLTHDAQALLDGTRKDELDVDEYAFAALNLYADIVDTFLLFLDLLGFHDPFNSARIRARWICWSAAITATAPALMHG